MAKLRLKGSPEYRLWFLNQLLPGWFRHTGLVFLALLALGFWGFGLLTGQSAALALAAIIAGVVILSFIGELFLHTAAFLRLKPQSPAHAFDRAAFQVLAGLKPPTCSALSLALLQSPAFGFYAEKLTLDPALLAPQFQDAGGEECFTGVLSAALASAQRRGAAAVGVGDLLAGLFRRSPLWRRLLDGLFITQEDLENILAWREIITREQSIRQRFWEPISFLRVRPLGVGWASGYTVTLDRFARDVAFTAGHDEAYHAIIHRDAIDRLEQVLATSAAANAILVGEVGVGRRAAIYAFAQRVYQGQSLGSLNYKRVLELNLEAVLSGLSDAGAVRNRLISVFNEAVAAGNVILVVHELDTFLGHKNIVGSGDLSELLTPYLQSPRFQIIATTTERGFERAIEPNAQLTSLFSKVNITEPSANETIVILEDLAWRSEGRYGGRVAYSALKEIVRFTDEYVLTEHRPLKAVRVLEDLLNSSAAAGRLLDGRDVEKLMTERLGFAVGQADEAERAKLLNLESELHERVIGQDVAIKLVAEALRRSRSGIRERRRPIGSFLFLGPTGVGKTSVAKALAAAFFGREESMARFDMSEFQQASSIAQLIGSATLEQGGRLTEAIKAKPFSLVLIDEIEKADPHIFDLFLQILDEGSVRDGLGDQISFANTIIIATSNAGSEFIREHIRTLAPAVLQTKLLDEIQRARIFRPEFLNRFDAVVPFHPLTREQLEQIAGLMLKDLQARVKTEANIELKFKNDIADFLAERGYQLEFGARPMRRVLQDTIESFIARALLEARVKSGETLTIGAADLG